MLITGGRHLVANTLVRNRTSMPLHRFVQSTPFDNLSLNDIVLVHMTDRFPANGVINSLYRGDHKGGIRNTVSFSLNHAAGGNVRFNNSMHKKYAILCPLPEVILLNGAPLGGDELDLCWDNEVDVNSERTIVLANNQSDKLEFPSNARMQVVHVDGEIFNNVPLMIEGMGFQSLVEAGANSRFTWVPLASAQPEAITMEHVDSINAAKRLFRDGGFSYYKRIHFPLKNLENYLKLLAHCNPNSWLDSRLHADLQWFGQYTLQLLVEDIKVNPSLQKALPMDPSELLIVIQQSIRPEDAMHVIKKRWGIDLEEYRKQTQVLSYFGHPMQWAGTFHNIFHSSKYQQAIDTLNNKPVISLFDLMEYMQMVQTYEPTRYN